MASSSINRPAPFNPLPQNAVVTTAQLFNRSDIVTRPVVLNLPGSGRTEQKKFQITATGKVTTASATTATITLYTALVEPGTNPLTAASWTVLGATGAVAVGTTTAPFLIEADLVMDSQSGKIQGWFTSLVNNVLGAAAAVTNVLTGATQAVEPVAVFAVGVTFAAAAAGNIGTLGDFTCNC